MTQADAGTTMTRDDVLAEFTAAGALLEGHFILSSGLRSPTYLQCARVMMEADRGERLCAALAHAIIARLGADALDVVVSPAMGGVVVGFELGRQLGLQAIFSERVNGVHTLRRGFVPKHRSRTVKATHGHAWTRRGRCRAEVDRSRTRAIRIERLLGRGGMSVVYLAEQVALKRQVALKLLAPEPTFRERFGGSKDRRIVRGRETPSMPTRGSTRKSSASDDGDSRFTAPAASASACRTRSVRS